MTIKLKIKGQDVELSPAEAKALHDRLTEIFGDQKPAPFTVTTPIIWPISFPVQPTQWPPLEPAKPWEITYGPRWSTVCANN